MRLLDEHHSWSFVHSLLYCLRQSNYDKFLWAKSFSWPFLIWIFNIPFRSNRSDWNVQRWEGFHHFHWRSLNFTLRCYWITLWNDEEASFWPSFGHHQLLQALISSRLKGHISYSGKTKTMYANAYMSPQLKVWSLRDKDSPQSYLNKKQLDQICH